MKKFTYPLFFLLFFAFTGSALLAQTTSRKTRCSSDEVMDKLFRNDPALRSRYEKYQQQLNEQLQLMTNNNGLQLRTNAIATIPVVVHILLPDPNIVTVATVQKQMDTLNYYYGTQTATDSLRVYDPFRTTYGRTEIRFCMAQRDPNNLPTNGITRKVNNNTYTAGAAGITSSAAGGQDAWDTKRFLNLWVVSFSDGTLGYSYLPGAFPVGDGRAGFVCDYRAFGAGATYLYPDYNLGKTAVHEIGHFLNLSHPWGSGGSNPGCTGTDFITETPPTAGPTFGCAASPVLDACSPAAPGKMAQNHMDYADDRCMFLFTKEQCTRMRSALDNSPDRNTLLTSNGCQPVISSPYDASIAAIVNPLANQGFCGATSVTPVVTLLNLGSNTLTSATITVSLDGGAPTNFAWTGSLALGAQVNVTLAAITGISGGSHNLNICVTNINGGQTDGDPTNNCKTVTFSIIAGGSGGIAAPLVEGFENTTFPPAGWVLSTGPGTSNWARTTLAAKSGLASARMNWYSFTSGNVSNMTSPLVNFSSFDNAFLRFDYAYKLYNATSLGDTLDVQVSTDCGNTWISVWKFGGNSLTTTPGTNAGSWTPLPADWTQTPISVNLTAYRNSPIYVRFRARSGFGQNLYLDDINLVGTVNVNNNASISAINVPLPQFCGSTFTPSVVVKNEGIIPLTSVKINTRVDNGTLATQTFTGLNIAPNATQTFTLTGVTGASNGSHVYTAYTTEPNGVADQFPSSDTLRKPFIANIAVATPIAEGFEGTTFPPAGWSVINPNGNITWARSTAAAKTGIASAWLNHYSYVGNGEYDYLRAPLVNYSTFDSALVTFHYAYKQYSATANDTLEVVISNDCGATWTSAWKRGGRELATAAGLGGVSFIPTAAQWTSAPIRVDLSPFKGSDMYVAFRSRNYFGNNTFVDDINIFGKNAPDFDAVMAGIRNPTADQCEPTFAPRVFVANAGKVTMTSVKVNYTVDNGAVVTTTFTGLNVLKGRDTLLTLPTISNLTVGNHNLVFYTTEPNAVADQNIVNDTLKLTINVKSSVNAPLVEGFEGSVFPPAGWEITQQPADAITWKKINRGRNSGNSATINNYNYAFGGRVDNLITPVIRYTGADSVFLKFDIAAATYSFPGSTGLSLDTLEVLVSRDCGVTYSSVYKKYGFELQTVNNPNEPYETEFFPTIDGAWRKDSINLTALLGSTNNVRVFFKNTENFENNIYLDNINFATKVLPAKVKTNGFMIAPNPFTNYFTIQHLLPPTDLRGFGVYNAVGQLVVSRSFNGNADSYMDIQMGHLPAGTYVIKMIYNNRTFSQKLIKYK